MAKDQEGGGMGRSKEICHLELLLVCGMRSSELWQGLSRLYSGKGVLKCISKVFVLGLASGYS